MQSQHGGWHGRGHTCCCESEYHRAGSGPRAFFRTRMQHERPSRTARHMFLPNQTLAISSLMWLKSGMSSRLVFSPPIVSTRGRSLALQAVHIVFRLPCSHRMSEPTALVPRLREAPKRSGKRALGCWCCCVPPRLYLICTFLFVADTYTPIQEISCVRG